MTAINFNTLQSRVLILKKIDSELSEEDVIKRFQEEESKLYKQDEQLIFVSTRQSPHPEKGNILYRTTMTYPTFDENKISSFSYPHFSKTRLNRCNIPKNPVFYCSDTSSISINEALHNIECNFPIYIYLSEWIVNANILWKILPFIFKGLPSINRAFEFAEKYKQEIFDTYKNILPNSDIVKYIDYYHDVFRKENHFEFSSIISHAFLYEDHGDIIFYPAVQVEAEGNNYAINKKWINDKTISLSKVHKFRVEKIDKVYNWYLVGIGIPANETILNWETVQN